MLPWIPSPTGSDALTRPDFLTNAKAQLDADHFGLDKVKRRSLEYLAVVRLRTMIAQEAEAEQAKAHEVTLKKAIEDPAAAASEGDKQKENESAYKALIKVGNIPSSPLTTEGQATRKATKAIKAPILL